MGEIPDGVYNVLGETLQLISGPESTVAQLKRIAGVALEVRDLEEAEARQKISNEAPELEGLWKSLSDVQQKTIAFATLVVSIVSLLLSTYDVFLRGNPAQEKTNELLERAITQSETIDREEIERLAREIQDASPPDSASDESSP